MPYVMSAGSHPVLLLGRSRDRAAIPPSVKAAVKSGDGVMTWYRRLLEAAPVLTREDFDRLRSGWNPRVTRMHFAVAMALRSLTR